MSGKVIMCHYPSLPLIFRIVPTHLTNLSISIFIIPNSPPPSSVVLFGEVFFYLQISDGDENYSWLPHISGFHFLHFFFFSDFTIQTLPFVSLFQPAQPLQIPVSHRIVCVLLSYSGSVFHVNF